MANPKFVIQRNHDQFSFHLTAANGEIILTSERYTTKASAENGVASVKESAPIDRRYDKLVSTNDKPYFVLKAGNNEIIGTSQMYASREARDGGMNLSWAGPRFRLREEKGRSRIRWFVHADDVERVRLQRLGPTMSELESFVLSELAAGRTASEIVRSGRQVTLADAERIRDQDARLSGACVVDAATARELRELFAIESMNSTLLLAHVRAFRQRFDALAGRLNRAAMAQE